MPWLNRINIEWLSNTIKGKKDIYILEDHVAVGGLADRLMAIMAKHITTTAKLPHPYEYVHDMTGYNYRLPNLNAALACAQFEQLDFFIDRKRELAETYKTFFEFLGIPFVHEPDHARSN